MDSIVDVLRKKRTNDQPVWLLKTPSQPYDAYEHDLKQSERLHLLPIFVPVLEHRFRHETLQTIRRHVERFAFAGGSPANARQQATDNLARRYSGIVFTSQRAVEAFEEMLGRIQAHSSTSQLFNADMPIYVVGPATARGAKSLGLDCQIIGEESGNGESLARFILSHHKTLPRTVTHINDRKLPLLFPVGEQRRDTIPKALESGELQSFERIPIQEVVVYETGEMADFEHDFTTYLLAMDTLNIHEQWIVIFSPQGCEALLNSLGWLDNTTGKFSEERRATASTSRKTRVITIGPTTYEYLVDRFGFFADSCASQPSPQGVLQAIAGFGAERETAQDRGHDHSKSTYHSEIQLM